MVELLLFEAPKCHVFKLPNKKVGGHKAEEWEGCNIWTGFCRVFADDEKCVIRLQDETGKLFAECPVYSDRNTKSVEPVTDSSRYFVLRIEDKAKGQHAFIGIGFEERSQAFDFSVSLTDFKKSVQQMHELQTNAGKNTFSDKVYDDLSLKSGQKIHVDLSGKIKSSETNKQPLTKSGLAPPPRSSRQLSGDSGSKMNQDSNPMGHNTHDMKPAHDASLPPVMRGNSFDIFASTSGPTNPQPPVTNNMVDALFGNTFPQGTGAPATTTTATASANATSLDDLFRAF